jgi:hypothetical protein
MKVVNIIAAMAICITVVADSHLQKTAAESPTFSSQAATSTSAPPKKVPVYVNNFELDVLPATPGQKLAAAAAGDASQLGAKTEPPDPAQQASRLVDLMATKLVAALENAGHPAQRLRPEDERPSNGVQIRGIFAEIDNENHWRRAVIRTGTDTGRMEAMVAVANLARPDQALYEIAHLPGNENKPGAVITLSPYVPLQKYDVDKDAGEDLFARVASRMVADLSDLLNRNPGALPD